jgi:hypothetical protein
VNHLHYHDHLLHSPTTTTTKTTHQRQTSSRLSIQIHSHRDSTITSSELLFSLSPHHNTFHHTNRQPPINMSLTLSNGDLRSHSQQYKRDAAHKHKWALGAVENGRGAEGKAKPVKVYPT